MTNTQKAKGNKCDFCNKKKYKKSYGIWKVLIQTESKTLEVGILTLLKDLNAYVLEQCIHLSGSEIILLRPDILLEFLCIHYKEKVLHFGYQEYIICNDCFEEYKKLIPAR
jgi:hypothetical protein